jgi:hypothetical protein
MNMPANELTSFGHALDLSPQSFGELRRSNDIAHDATQLRARMAEDGYLYLPGLLDVEEVLAARREITERRPTAWPRMALRDVRAFGRAWELVAERAGDQQKVSVRSGGKTLMTGSGPAGKTYALTFPKGKKAPLMR